MNMILVFLLTDAVVSGPGKNSKAIYTASGGRINQDSMYKTQETISGDAITDSLDKMKNAFKAEEKASWIESAVTALVILLCDGIRNAISWVVGEDNISIDDVLFNNFSSTRLSIFSSMRSGDHSGDRNNYLEDSGMLDTIDENGETEEGVITKYFMLFRNIAIAVYLVMLLYMGVSILLHSTGRRKEKYKAKMVDWLKGVIILIMFPYVMKYIIVLNDSLVEFVEEMKQEVNLPTNQPSMSGGVSYDVAKALKVVNSDAGNGNIMDTMKAQAKDTGRLAYAMLYLFLVIKMIGFIYIYFKRLISVIFLIIIFPLVTISYAIDKVGDGKSQAFNTWFKEFVLNVFMQAFQALNYVIVMSVIFALTASGGTTNIILMLVGLEYVSKGDEILRGMFTKMSGGGANTVPKNLSEATKTIATMSVAKKISENVVGVGKRFSSAAHKASDMRDAYYQHTDQKYEEKIREREIQAQMEARSMSNPEWAATVNVSGNMDKLFAAPGTYTDEEMKETLDRLAVAQGDAELKGDFEAKYDSLTPEQQKQVDEMMEKNNAINETINGNVGVNGVLTNLEINFNAGILIEIFENGSKVEEHMRLGMLGPISAKEARDYELYKYMQNKKMVDSDGNIIRDSAGNEVSLASYIKHAAETRALDDNELNKMKQLQKFSGNVTGLDDKTKTGTNRVTRKTRHDALEKREVSEREIDRKNALLNRVGTTGISNSTKKKREDAARLVARIKEYNEAVNEGSSEGCSATEMMKLANEWKELSADTDAGVTEILSKLSDTTETDSSVRSDVDFNLEQFTAMASLAVVYDKEHLEGTDAEKIEIYNDAVQNIVELSTGVRREENGNGIQMVEYTPDHLAQNMINRAELDDVIQEFADKTTINTKNYVRTGGTQESKRNARAIQQRRAEIENDYDRMQVNSSMTRANLIRRSVEFGGATASAVAAPLNVSAGVAGAALLTGSTRAQVDPAGVGASFVMGTSLENAVEKIVPGTNASNSKNRAIGNRLSQALGESYDATNDATINAELNARYVQNNRARNMIDNVKNKLR